MNNYFKSICEKINKEFDVENIEIIDNSYKHKGHKFFSPEKYHIHLNVKSLYLNSISRVTSHKMIMKVLKNDLKTKIHALQISID